MGFLGQGTRESPIALDDSEDEVLHELYRHSPTNLSPVEQPTPDIHAGNTIPEAKKRKRGQSFNGQDIPASGPNHFRHPQKSHTSLVNRLSQPESKKARKRRRKAERQAAEEARSRNINWLSNPQLFSNSQAPSYPAPSTSAWTADHQNNQYADYSYLPFSSGMPSSSTVLNGIRAGYSTFHEEYDPLAFENYDHDYDPLTILSGYSHPQPGMPIKNKLSLTSEWVTSMAMAAEAPLNTQDDEAHIALWSALHTQMAVPPVQPPPLPPPISNTANQPSKLASALPPKPVEYHSLPQKPPTAVPSIGMKPDQDPNSKHGIFHITETMKDVGSDAKNRKAQYIPNPARTLVMEQLPKSHRQPDWIHKWSRNACGCLPVHVFIDGQVGKALVEFAAAELARKAWSSPKLGTHYAGLKPHQLKGKPREDLIKVWWYRVDGVGANSGVGEIEEGEIEGDYAEKEQDPAPIKETRKERKARLARDREAKKARETETQTARDSITQVGLPGPTFPVTQPAGMNLSTHQSLSTPPISTSRPPHHTTTPSHMPFNYTVLPQRTSTTTGFLHVSSHRTEKGKQIAPMSSSQPVNKAAFSTSMYLDERSTHNDDESIASSTGRSMSIFHDQRGSSDFAAITSGQADDVVDYEEIDMDVDQDEEHTSKTIFNASPPLLAVQSIPPLHSSLPPRPSPLASFTTNAPKLPVLPKPAFQSSGPIIPTGHKLPSIPPHQPLSKPFHAKPQSTLPASMTVAQEQPATQQRPTSLPTAVTSMPSKSSGSASSTTSFKSMNPIPSEPKAMKNAPTEPSFTKRSLLARQKELEEKIAESKSQLAAAASTKKPLSVASQPATTLASISSTITNSVGLITDTIDKQAMEDKLRKLVLQSRNSRLSQKTDAPKQQSQPVAANEAILPKKDTSTTNGASSTSSSGSPAISLEDLAVSFITQTIDTIKSQPDSSSTQPILVPAQSQADVKHELAAKQQRLERHITESKALMEKFAQCRTRADKDEMLKLMRDHTRQYEQEMKTTQSTASALSASPSVSNAIHKTNHSDSTMQNIHSSAPTAHKFLITRWPVSQQDAGVLILSDDEDGDESEENNE